MLENAPSFLFQAKCDNITALERFRYKSEPTWMLISKGKMVSLMFGADAPKLTRLIMEELKNEQLVASGEKIRENIMEITEMTEVELTRNEEADSVTRKAKEKENAKRAKEIHDRKVEECHNILNNLHSFGVVLIFPNAREKYWEVMADTIQEAGLAVHQTEKVKLNKDAVEDMLYFCDNKLSPKNINDFSQNRVSIALLMKRSSEHLSGEIDEVVLQMVYGNSRKPPGDGKSPSQRLMPKPDNVEEEEENILIGIWAPPNNLSKALALKHLFPNLSAPYKFPEVEPSPFYVAVGYDAFKAPEVMELSEKYPGQVMAMGFFTSDIPPAAQLIAKTVKEFDERTDVPTYEEKIVIQLAKTNPDCLMAFSELGPSYMSADAEAGEIDCQYLFPQGYNVAQEEIVLVKKKTKKKGKPKPYTQEETASTAASDLTKDQSDLDHEELEEVDSEEEKVAGETLEYVEVTGADKATSPIEEEKIEE
ncbi:unnamed protein product [Phaedon cochleariae]|uniref:DUF4746 domain-containing protein n=1 Tax=Phaedon cochleariae TaxID=80249 RepID=A0A9N9SKR2_PHACE|nr:unnamed protein product [Phaedon cochleariae]